MSAGRLSAIGQWGAAAALATSLAVVYFRAHALREPAYDQICREYRQILDRSRELAADDADENDWDEFELDARGRLRRRADELLAILNGRHEQALAEPPATAHPRDRMLALVCRPLYRLGRYDLPALVAVARSQQSAAAQLLAERIEQELEALRETFEEERARRGARSTGR